MSHTAPFVGNAKANISAVQSTKPAREVAKTAASHNHPVPGTCQIKRAFEVVQIDPTLVGFDAGGAEEYTRG